MGSRADYSQGGRVQLMHGGVPHGGEGDGDYDYELTDEQRRALEDAKNSMGGGGGGNYGGGGGGDGDTNVVTPPSDQDLADTERRKRILETGRGVESIAAGTLPDTLPKGTVSLIDRTETESKAVKMSDPTDVVGTKVSTTPDEAVSTMTAATAKTPDKITTSTMDASLVEDSPEVKAAKGTLSEGSIAKLDEIRTLSGPAEAAKITDQIVNASKAKNVDAIISAGAFVPQVTGIGAQISDSPEAEKQSREAITGEAATSESAQIISSVGYEAAQQRAVKGTAAQGAAANMLAQTASIPNNIAAAIVEDPAVMIAQIDSEDVEVQAAIAALPTEALVS